jgi:hypothetical protein
MDSSGAPINSIGDTRSLLASESSSESCIILSGAIVGHIVGTLCAAGVFTLLGLNPRGQLTREHVPQPLDLLSPKGFSLRHTFSSISTVDVTNLSGLPSLQTHLCNHYSMYPRTMILPSAKSCEPPTPCNAKVHEELILRWHIHDASPKKLTDRPKPVLATL